jgi:hypothetical protein
MRSKTRHNSDLNARAMTEVSHLKPMLPLAMLLLLACDCSRVCTRQVRNQYFILLSVLLGRGGRMAEHSHSHKKVLIDYTSGAIGLPWAVDAATKLENFHSYAMALYRIGAAEAAGSKRQRAAFRLAQWLFDRGAQL